jgi:hypothetical protein
LDDFEQGFDILVFEPDTAMTDRSANDVAVDHEIIVGRIENSGTPVAETLTRSGPEIVM